MDTQTAKAQHYLSVIARCKKTVNLNCSFDGEHKDMNQNSSYISAGKMLIFAWIAYGICVTALYFRNISFGEELTYLTKVEKHELIEQWYSDQKVGLALGIDPDPKYRLHISNELEHVLSKGLILRCLRALDISRRRNNIYRVAGSATFSLPNNDTAFTIGVISFYDLKNSNWEYGYTKLVVPHEPNSISMNQTNHSILEGTTISEYRTEGECSQTTTISRAKVNDKAFFSSNNATHSSASNYLTNILNTIRNTNVR